MVSFLWKTYLFLCHGLITLHGVGLLISKFGRETNCAKIVGECHRRDSSGKDAGIFHLASELSRFLDDITTCVSTVLLFQLWWFSHLFSSQRCKVVIRNVVKVFAQNNIVIRAKDLQPLLEEVRKGGLLHDLAVRIVLNDFVEGLVVLI